jgi:hypothetical protein
MSARPVLIDTSAWLLALRRDYLPAAKELVDQLLQENRAITTGIVKLELLGGTKTEKEFQRLKSRLDALESVETDEALWTSTYDLAFLLRRNGITVPFTDIIIAASALNKDAVLVHADSHFDVMTPLIGLVVESFVDKLRGLERA